ncbi:MAG: hypothetical protein C4K58_02910 [Flavobacteriaceae bacterium]|nr:MAG: hypothetical protein C4K58_02910 [Flavobacteriaceae bacterium]
MKYIQLTKEQLERLSEDFAKFLAVQKIDKSLWESYKKDNSKMVEEQLNLFSDLIWEKTLTKVKYLEHLSSDHFNLFCFDENSAKRIVISTKEKDLLAPENLSWALSNLDSPKVNLLRGEKKFSKERNLEIFELILSGAQICQGDLFKALEKSL